MVNKDIHSDIVKTNPLQYLNCNRFDVSAKVLYAKHKRLNAGLQHAIKIYKQHLYIIHRYDIHEQDGSKHNFSDFITTFDSLIDTLNTHDFDTAQSVIPVKKGNIMNGAHRTAICIDTNKDIYIKQVTDAHYLCRASEFQQQDIFSDTYDSMILEYIRRKTNTRIAVLFPMAFSQLHTCMHMLQQKCEYLGYKDIYLSANGMRNFYHIMYEGESLGIKNGINNDGGGGV